MTRFRHSIADAIMNRFAHRKLSSPSSWFPSFLILVAVVFYPFVYNVVISFSNMSLRHIRDWSIIGPQQYSRCSSSPPSPISMSCS